MTIEDRIKHLQALIRQQEMSCQRPAKSVELLAVSKKQTCQAIIRAYKAGQTSFGESYLQEALEKIHELSTLPLSWHFIGTIQSNKTQAIAQHFSWAHGICRKKIAQLLNDERPSCLPALNVCIQVNVDGEETKSGVKPEDVAELATDIMRMPHLKLRGLMVIPKPTLDEQEQYLTFSRVAVLLHELNTRLDLNMDTLSMGMSDDLLAAVRAGSTMVRVGRAIFGERS